MTVSRRLAVFVVLLSLIAGSGWAQEGTHKVITDGQQHYSVLPIDADPPIGWANEGFVGGLGACVAYIQKARIADGPIEGAPSEEILDALESRNARELYGLMYFNDANEVAIVAVNESLPFIPGTFPAGDLDAEVLWILLHPSGSGEVAHYAPRDDYDGDGKVDSGDVLGTLSAGAAAADERAIVETTGDANLDGIVDARDVLISSVTVGLMDIDTNISPAWRCPGDIETTLVAFEKRGGLVAPESMFLDGFESGDYAAWDPGDWDPAVLEEHTLIYARCPGGFKPGS